MTHEFLLFSLLQIHNKTDYLVEKQDMQRFQIDCNGVRGKYKICTLDCLLILMEKLHLTNCSKKNCLS